MVRPPTQATQVQNPLNSWQLIIINVGFVGVHVVWGLQMANGSAIFESLGAKAQQIPLLWLAAPVTGLIVQPLVGYWSDRTCSPLGKRRPYFLAGALFGCVTLAALPLARGLTMAVLLLWLLNLWVNVAMTPFRSYVVDVVPLPQQTTAYTWQSCAHGLGAFTASAMPWGVVHLWRQHPFSLLGNFPASIECSLWLGSALFLGALLLTVTQSPRPLQNNATSPEAGIDPAPFSISTALRHCPPLLKQLSWVQGLSWISMFCLFLYFPPAVARDIFGAHFEISDLYAQGIEWTGLCFALLNLTCMAVSLGLPHLARRIDLPTLHGACLLVGALSLGSLHWVSDRYLLLGPMVGLGVAWASMLSMPYAMLARVLPPELNGLYMGLFNCSITLPQIFVSLGLGQLVQTWVGGDRMAIVALGGIAMLISALLSFPIGSKKF
ncbi:MFS transporter [Lyngbya confervoides]|uniref:MFS transporter n=1 Tax=Lyngbya confervoides BDU141951 TaxID=1574623 RepID=A0ABD4T3F3_9CYAN|nr:MFS transporter [Lyngbya confervoides]MCM1983135.1 MFS transporter [Lyngbya confervoides BDU141951]